ncbi:CoA-binding protein [Candidatus Woesearchaeota archaeon]|nr:CoA-binding protein [Candidatus Woesearchaeota archaeon]
MSIMIDDETRVMIQAITGKQGRQACKEMLDYKVKVVCGVTPGKTGQNVDGVPVYGSVNEALHNHDVDATVIFVPPMQAKEAVMDAINNGIKLINIITENIPVHDTAYFLEAARKSGAVIVGPSSVGIISPGKCKMGPIGGADNSSYMNGPVGIISKSGGMSSETANLLTQEGIGQSTVIGIGGDRLIGSDFVDMLKMFERDKDTKCTVIFGEIGGTYEELVAESVSRGEITKPIAAFVSGNFASNLPNMTLGHAGAIVEGTKGTRQAKVEALRKAGVKVAEVHHHILDEIKMILGDNHG